MAGLGLLVVRHGDESEATRPARITIRDNRDFLYFSMLSECLPQLLLGRLKLRFPT